MGPVVRGATSHDDLLHSLLDARLWLSGTSETGCGVLGPASPQNAHFRGNSGLCSLNVSSHP